MFDYDVFRNLIFLKRIAPGEFFMVTFICIIYWNLIEKNFCIKWSFSLRQKNFTNKNKWNINFIWLLLPMEKIYYYLNWKLIFLTWSKFTYNFFQISDKKKKLFEEDGVDMFQLCASILFHESDKDIITIPGNHFQ